MGWGGVESLVPRRLSCLLLHVTVLWRVSCGIGWWRGEWENYYGTDRCGTTTHTVAVPVHRYRDRDRDQWWSVEVVGTVGGGGD